MTSVVGSFFWLKICILTFFILNLYKIKLNKMKLLKKLMLTLMLVIGFSFAVNAQSGWSTSRWYQVQGESWTDWQNVFVGYDMWGNPVYRTQCRDTNWYREYRSGTTYRWGMNGWYSYSYSGYAWSCRWSSWYWC